VVMDERRDNAEIEAVEEASCNDKFLNLEMLGTGRRVVCDIYIYNFNAIEN